MLYRDAQIASTNKTYKNAIKLISEIKILSDSLFSDIWELYLGSTEKKFKEKLRKRYRSYLFDVYEKLKKVIRLSTCNEFYRQMFLLNQMNDNNIFSRIPRILLSIMINPSSQVQKRYIKNKKNKKYGPLSTWLMKGGTLRAMLNKQGAYNLSTIESLLLGGLLDKPIELKKRLHYIIGGRNVKTIGGKNVAVYYGGLSKFITIGRTVAIRGLNAGSYAAILTATDYNTNGGLHRIWSAVIDSRTRNQSEEMNGQTVGLNEVFVYPNGATSFYPANSGYPEYDVNCRCSVIYESEDGDKDIDFSEKKFSEWLNEHQLAFDDDKMIINEEKK